ncbi:sensor histidine kinase [Streptomyces sp. TS71-3]|uniref:sensor histidine kinase n=1 Tax=Streptomyces sp. TS71-3 TaxID=2733862 RepID=UPI0020171E7A|nr:histidine kinase [Streptomyces sp. TS71-3]
MRWLLPSALVRELDPAFAARRSRRTLRDWLVDFSCFLAAIVLGLAAAHSTGRDAELPSALTYLDQILGALSCGAVWLRRRWPVGFAVAMLLAGTVSDTSGGAGLVALFTLAVHRPFPYVAWIGGGTIAVLPFFYWFRPDPNTPYAVSVAFSVLLLGAAVGWGMFARSRRQLLLSLRDQARRAESEAALRAEQAQRLAREAIAREMHDVLAHRLTLLSVHAGALEFRPDAPGEEVARAAGVIRESSHEALQDLRQIIGVLRAGESGPDAGHPQPTLAGLGALVEEVRAAGMRVDLAGEVPDHAAVPAATGRTAYRIAQECLTNARKHAPGALVTVRLSGAAGDGLTLSVSNPAPPGRVPHVPGSGQGLIGLTERATLAGGRLEHGPSDGGGFLVRAWLPWPA